MSITLPPPAGLIIASDPVGGEHYQKTKLSWGAAGSVNDMVAEPARSDKQDTTNATLATILKGFTAATASVLSLNSAIASQTLRTATAGRLGLLVFNDSTANLYIKYGITATITDFTVKVLAGGYWEMPFPIYTGRVDVIWDAVSGAARHTELT